ELPIHYDLSLSRSRDHARENLACWKPDLTGSSSFLRAFRGDDAIVGQWHPTLDTDFEVSPAGVRDVNLLTSREGRHPDLRHTSQLRVIHVDRMPKGLCQLVLGDAEQPSAVLGRIEVVPDVDLPEVLLERSGVQRHENVA